MAYDNDMDMVTGLLLPNFHGEIYDFSRQCGRHYELTLMERALSEFIYWARNKNIGVQESMKRRFYPGPHGIKTKKGWFPNPMEGCDAFIKFDSNHGPDNKYVYDPWTWWKHCKSLAHIEYLVKNRIGILLQDFMRSQDHHIKSLISIIEKNEQNLIEQIPEHTPIGVAFAGDNGVWLIDEYISDVSSGKFIRPYQKIKHKNTRYDIIKKGEKN